MDYVSSINRNTAESVVTKYEMVSIILGTGVAVLQKL
jgi:hypothetical protein